MVESLIDVVDEIRNLLEPDGSGVAKNDDVAQPFSYEHNTLYAWTGGPDEHRQYGDGRADEEHFTVEIGYAVSDLGERRTKDRRRDISVALDAKAHGYAAVVRANRTRGTLWRGLAITIRHNDIRTVGKDAKRGFRATITGWRTVGP